MSTGESQSLESTSLEALDDELQRMRGFWWCFLMLGIAMIILGFSVIGCAVFVSHLVAVVFGFLLLFGGVVQIISSFWAGKWSGFVLHMLIGILYVVVGFIMVDNPTASLAAITLLIAVFLIVGGVFRIVVSLTQRFRDWGWVLLNGIICMFLGFMIHENWPESSLVVIGLFIGIEMLFNGLSWVMLGLGLRKAVEPA